MLVTSCLFSLGLILMVGATPRFHTGTNHEETTETSNPVSVDKRMMVIRKPTLLWTKGIMPYIIRDEVKDQTPEYNRIMAFIEDQSCIRFTYWNKNTEKEFGLGHPGHVDLYKGNGCHSFTVGLNKSPKGVRVSCCTGKACLHEFGHALGFFHEQSNPKRDGWIRVNYQNIAQGKQGIYEKTSNHNANSSLPYDISSIMHYEDWMMSDGGPTFTKMFPDLIVAYQYHYFFMEMSGGYSCHEKPQCHGKILHCENDGYQTILHGKCACKCPAGLDANNLCRTPLKKVTTATWPKGQYALPQPLSGCPSGGSFQTGHLMFSGPGGNSITSPSHMKGKVQGKQAHLHFCSRTRKDDVFDFAEGAKFNWPFGNYCVYMKGETCPTGFTGGSIHYNSTTTPTTFGQIPSGSFNKNMELKFCCQWRGFHHEPASFPTDKTFALFKHPDEKHCQTVEGMRYSEEKMTIHNSEVLKIDPMFNKWFKNYHTSLFITICYYRPADMNCGGIITLSKSNPETTIEMSGVGRTDLECTWVVKGDTSKGTLVFDFEEYNLKNNGADAANMDRIEVRHARIGQWGTEFKSMDGVGVKRKQLHTIRSVFDKMMVRFLTTGQSKSSFKAKFRWVANDEMCYDVEKRGANYDGNVNYTRSYTPCLPWAEVTDCPHHPFAEGDIFANLEGNACRNPDHSFHPWCYTSKTNCALEYCDVCALEKPYDRIDFCQQLKDGGFCTLDAAQAVKSCAKTCYDQLPNKSPVQKYPDLTCGPPLKTPRDGVFVGMRKASYKPGDTVDYKCKTIPTTVTSTCLTSGLWSDVGSSCLLCPEGQIFYNNACYGIVEKDKKFTYQQGVTECMKKGGALAAPRSKEEAHAIMNAVNHTTYYVWIDITDKEVEGTWKYKDGKTLVWKSWDVSEPNNKGSHGEDCAAMKQTTRWMDVPCSFHYNIVCALPTFKNTECLDVLGDTCPTLLAERPSLCIDYPDFALEYCRRSCGICESTDLRCNVKNPNPNVLTLSIGESSVGAGEFVNYQCDRFKYRVKGDVSRACLPSGKLTGEPLECGDCPIGFKLVNKECHGLLEDKQMTYADAQSQCKMLRGFLAMPKTKQENDAIGALAMGQKIWLGTTDQGKNNQFEWDDGVKIGWNNWKEGKANSAGGKHCAIMDESKQWINVHCTSPLRLVVACTIPKSDDDLCYDIEKDGGASYDGYVNYTRNFEPCLPWSEVTQCPHHPFKKGDETFNLVGNACRNPDNSYRPWCYTDKHGCKRSYCDVCGTEKPHDRNENCPQLKAQGYCHDQPDNALKYCSATCLEDLTVREPVHKYSDIHCGPPNPPSDGDVKGKVKSTYNVGDTVEYVCKTEPWSVYSRCQSTGLWSEAGFACLQKECAEHLFHSTCYHLVQNAHHFTYDESSASCKDMNGTVATPKSQLEANFIRDAASRKTVWVGINDKETEGTWVYENGKKLVWTHWNAVEPNNKGEYGEDCAVMGGSTGWLDVPCTYKYPVVCATAQKVVECQDFLPTKCPQLLAEKPTMCKDHPSYANIYCADTCGQCRIS